MTALGWTSAEQTLPAGFDGQKCHSLQLISCQNTVLSPRDMVKEQIALALADLDFLPISPKNSARLQETLAWTKSHFAALKSRLAKVQRCVQFSAQLGFYPQEEAAALSWLRMRAQQKAAVQNWRSRVEAELRERSHNHLSFRPHPEGAYVDFLWPQDQVDRAKKEFSRLLSRYSPVAVVGPLPAYCFMTDVEALA